MATGGPRPRTPPEPLVVLGGVTAGYGGAAAVTDVSLEVARGSFTGIVGPSGSGKTTLLRVMLGLLRPSAGTVTRARGLRVGYVPQLETVDWSFPVTVRQVLLMARLDRRWPWSTRRERAAVDAVLERLGLAGLADRHIRDLSGGQQQRVFLARAVGHDPDLVVLDEPTSGVDVASRHEVLHLLADLHADGLTVVLTTHDLNGMATHLPWLVCLNRRVVAAGPPAEVLVPAVLEATYGAPLEVLEHGGMRVVVDPPAFGGARRPAAVTPTGAGDRAASPPAGHPSPTGRPTTGRGGR